jgi:hypothetical protein
MNGELAQLAALTAHGNAALFAPGQAVELAPSHSTFRYVNFTSFDWYRTTQSSDCISWWESLQQREVTRLYLTRGRRERSGVGAEHYVSAFAGGLTLELVASRPHSHELWRGQWQVTAPKHPDQRIWSVAYEGREGTRTSFAELQGHFEQVRLNFRESLEEIGNFARSQGYTEWEPWFTEALELLDSPAPVPPYHADILPRFGYPLRARQLMAAAIRGWVFGGMGSWNDLSPPDTAEYERVTAAFFSATISAVCASAEAFDPLCD